MNYKQLVKKARIHRLERLRTKIAFTPADTPEMEQMREQAFTWVSSWMREYDRTLGHAPEMTEQTTAL